ncbi:MAG TPA: MFS transporter, partial [Chloroflexota bacterium]|nr:MFS transporter [Chloroflexota bacterium]
MGEAGSNQSPMSRRLSRDGTVPYGNKGVLNRFAEVLRSNQILIWLCLITLVNQLGFGMVIPVLPLFVQTFGGTASAVGAAVALYGLGRLLFDLPMGQLTERLGRRQVLIVGEAITVVGTLLCALAPTYDMLLVGRFVGGVGGATVLTVGQIVVADVSRRENRGRMMGVYMSFFQFAVGIGPVIGGFVATALGPRAPFFAFAVFATAAGLVGVAKLAETRGLGEQRSHGTKSRSIYREILGNPSF